MGIDGTLGILEDLNVAVPMRDGVTLRGNLWRPAAGGPFPALLMRTPYGKPAVPNLRYLRAGYAVMTQDSRGRYASDGTFTVFSEPTRDSEDGYDTVEWLAAQPWCNGRIGTFGASYCGWMQWMTAKARPPHLLAMCARSIPLELTDIDWPGAFKLARRLHWWFTTIAPDLRRRAGWPPPHTPAEARAIWAGLEQGRWLGTLPVSAVTHHLPPPLDRQAADWLLEPNRRAWQFAAAHHDIEVPNLDFTGWYDHCSSIGHLTGMQTNGRTALAREQTRVVIGPWAHGTIGQRETMGIDFGPQAALDTQDLEMRWFDHWLKGIDNGVDRHPPVRYYVIGADTWKNSGTWPPPGLTEIALHLASDGQANGPDGNGRLQEAADSPAEADRYRYDPHDPVPTVWGPDLVSGVSDRRRLAHRRDILVYRTEPLAADIEIAGSPELVLHAASSAPDTDFVAWLIDERTDGPAIEVSSGMVRARHRNTLDREEFITPGEVVEYRIRLGPTACRFRRGNRIRLDIASSDFPNIDRNHNTGRNDLVDPEFAGAHQTVLHSHARPSRLILKADHTRGA